MNRFVCLFPNLCLYLVLSGCSGNKPASKRGAFNRPSSSEIEGILFPEVSEFADAGIEFMTDSLWFEAQASFDSALVHLAERQATDSLEGGFRQAARHFQDSIYSLLVQAVSHSTGMQLPLPWTYYWDVEMENISDTQLDSIRNLTSGMSPRNYELPIKLPLHPRIMKAMAALTGQGRRYFGEWLNRKSLYEDMILKKLSQNGLPRDLIYLAMVESGFSPRAFSRAKASGIWQFIRPTGKRYGLKSDWWIDERRDPEKSTDAAIAYLSALYQEFGDWDMAMAGYNCGEGRIRRNLKNDSTKTFWGMTLPKETRKYVPKIYAAMVIGKDPQRYGFYIEPKSPIIYDTVTVRHCLSVTLIAEITGVEERDIKKLNPELRRWCTPPRAKTYLLKIPAGSRDAFVKKYAKLDKKNLVTWQRHTVSRGETLGYLARKYGISISAIRSTNNLRGNLIRIGQSLVIPLQATTLNSKRARSGRSKKNKTAIPAKVQKVNYTVKKGDNLYDIAGRFGTSVTAVMQLNGLNHGSIIKPGQEIKIPITDGIQPAPSQRTQAHSKKSYRIYRVRAGDNLSTISQRLGVSVRNLKSWNALPSSQIKIGQKLKYLSPKDGHEVYYIVKSSDNLWDIARKFNISMKKIREMNRDLPKVLKPGMKIRVK